MTHFSELGLVNVPFPKPETSLIDEESQSNIINWERSMQQYCEARGVDIAKVLAQNCTLAISPEQTRDVKEPRVWVPENIGLFLGRIFGFGTFVSKYLVSHLDFHGSLLKEVDFTINVDHAEHEVLEGFEGEKRVLRTFSDGSVVAIDNRIHMRLQDEEFSLNFSRPDPFQRRGDLVWRSSVYASFLLPPPVFADLPKFLDAQNEPRKSNLEIHKW